jgi:hypothetical protein
MQRVLRLRACRAASTTQHVLRARVPEGKRTVEKHERVIQLLNLPRAHVVHHRSNPFLSSRIFFHLSPPRGRARPEEMSQLPFGFNILHPRSSAPSFVPQATPPSMGSDWSSPMGYPQSPGMQVSMPAINTDSFGLASYARGSPPPSGLHALKLCAAAEKHHHDGWRRFVFYSFAKYVTSDFRGAACADAGADLQICTTDAGAAHACLVGANPRGNGSTTRWSHPMGTVSARTACLVCEDVENVKCLAVTFARPLLL